ncbi:hypothetical protein PRIPAC_89522, partial [Pristionchus pacificus]|uniref:Uncharacterized protein n=1 Tax=Pristionchus pacificus TaxID=54126 RepID=A0A2A6CV19_PRIPA
ILLVKLLPVTWSVEYIFLIVIRVMTMVLLVRDVLSLMIAPQYWFFVVPSLVVSLASIICSFFPRSLSFIIILITHFMLHCCTILIGIIHALHFIIAPDSFITSSRKALNAMLPGGWNEHRDYISSMRVSALVALFYFLIALYVPATYDDIAASIHINFSLVLNVLFSPSRMLSQTGRKLQK